MNTLLLKTGCLFLFGFIFFQSFQTETNYPILGQQEKIDSMEPKTDVMAVVAVHSSVVDCETHEDYLEQLAKK